MIYCTHHECRLDAASELSAMGNAIPSRFKEFIAKAAEVFELEVRCRKVPGRGRRGDSLSAPFPGEDK